MGFGSKVKDYQPTKTALFWSCVASIVLTMVVGFSWGGWTTGGNARAMAEDAREETREEFVASLCVERFVAAPNAAANLAELKETDGWEQDSFIEDGGWANIAAIGKPSTEAMDQCADELASMEDLPARVVDTSPSEPTES